VATAVNDMLFSRERMIDLSRLNEAERRVLRMLGEGHTAKSIASALDTTPAAVNERLREARRKTGVGSSRELARLLRATEKNRHEQMGMGRGAAAVAAPVQSDAEPWRPQMGVIAMLTFFLVAAAGAAALMSQQAPVSNDVDPLIGRPIENFPQPAELHAKLRAEAVDPAWAPKMENAIQARLMSMPLVGKDGNALRVTCGTTLCEIAGTLISPETKEQRPDPNSQLSRTVQDLQVPPLTDDLIHLGLKNEGASFTSGEGKPDRLIFLLYFARAAK
jgi:DNA-binding CsgD family transcriptional regulator